ncbi:MAG: DUF1080 domain-containing protein, partial [Planctomycetota bacterium]|nr:DUF1080 domain-containing protein [Planctomycetota bacterium]
MLPVLLTLACLSAQGGGIAIDPLANGLSDWEGDKRYWSLEEGVLTGRSTAELPCDETTYLTWLGGDVTDFVLRLEFKIESGNSGIQFRSERGPGFELLGYQADLEAGETWTGGLYEAGGRAVLGQRGLRVILDPDGRRRFEPLTPEAVEVGRDVAGEWHEYTVRAVGQRIELTIDGVLTCDVLDNDLAHSSRHGLIGLQLHQGPPMSVSFRNIRILRLDPARRREKIESGEFNLPHWIWLPGEPAADQEMWTRQSIDLGDLEDGSRATLSGSCDNAAKVFINGNEVIDWEEWWTPFRLDVTEHLLPGVNQLEAWGWNESGPAGLWLELSLQRAEDSNEKWFTTETWPVTDRRPPDWPDSMPVKADDGSQRWRIAEDHGALGADPWGSQLGFLDERLPDVLPAADLLLPDGFAAERIYSVPLRRQGSWVALAMDGAGRIYASSQHRDMYRLTVPPLGESGPVHATKLEVDIGPAQGLCWAFNSLYVVVAEGKQTGLWRLRDLDGNDTLEDAQLLKAFDGEGEHGPHAVVPGPDGTSLYVIAGNHVALPENLARRRPAPLWGEDQLLTRRADPNGHAVGIRAPGGWLCRTDEDGKDWELIAIGLRNSYDLAFNAEGEAFTFDSDMEWDIGLPWYRAPRILHLVSGAEFGWRHGSGKWPTHYPDSLPGIADSGLASPTGVTFGYNTSFPEPYRSSLLVADWAYGTLQAVTLTPQGSTYTGDFMPFASGRPFPVADMTAGPDGALYVVTGGRHTHSAIYRIWHEAGRAGQETQPVEDDAASKLRHLRRALEARHRQGATPVPWEYLSHPDRFIAHAARVALEHCQVLEWADRALLEDDLATALPALLALTRAAADSHGERIHQRISELPWDSLEQLELLPWLRLLALADIRAGSPPAKLHATRLARLEALFPTAHPLVNRELANLLARYGSNALARQAVDLLTSSPSSEDQIHMALVLSQVKTGWTLPLRRRYFQWLDKQAEAMTGGASLALYLDGIREDAHALLPPELAQHPDLLVSAPGATPVTSRHSAPFVQHWTKADLAPHLAQVDAPRDLAAGKLAFELATCLECHRFEGRGGATGPDLTGAGARFAPRDLLNA